VELQSQKNWPAIRDRYDEFLPSGEKNPNFVQRAETPKFTFGHPLVVNQKELVERISRDPLDSCYKSGGRYWIMNGVRYSEDPRSRKIVEKDEEEDV
jgi:hypothetical protein